MEATIQTVALDLSKRRTWKKVSKAVPDNDRVVEVDGTGWREQGWARFRNGQWLWEMQGPAHDGKPIEGSPVERWRERDRPKLW
jgi:hypothetical protein